MCHTTGRPNWIAHTGMPNKLLLTDDHVADSVPIVYIADKTDQCQYKGNDRRAIKVEIVVGPNFEGGSKVGLETVYVRYISILVAFTI